MPKPAFGLPSTMWTDIVRWQNASPDEKRESLERFYSRYRLPLIAFIRGRGHSSTEAEDLLHDFMLGHVGGKIFVSSDPSRGRFRNLLLASLRNFLVSRQRSASAEKRRPSGGHVALDEPVGEGLTLQDLLSEGQSPDEIYNRAWLVALLNNALGRLESEYQAKQRNVHLEVFLQRVVAPILHGDAKPSVGELAEKYSMEPASVSNLLVTAKRAFERSLREEIREYVSTEKEVSQEIEDLMRFLAALS